jgi:hypothetical protein
VKASSIFPTEYVTWLALLSIGQDTETMSARATREALISESTGKGFATERVATEVTRAVMNFMIAMNGVYVQGCVVMCK